MNTHELYINLCEVLGKQAAAKGNSPVGAIITRDNKIASEAGEAVVSKNDITCHAEIEAIRQAVQQLKTNDLSYCILYSTHEPCVMCAYAIRYYKIKTVVYKNKVSFLGGFIFNAPSHNKRRSATLE